MLFVLLQQGFQFVAFSPQIFQRLLQFVVLVAHFHYSLFICFCLFVDFFYFSLVVPDKFEVLAGDVIVIVLQLFEIALMIADQLIDVKVLSLFYLVDFNL